MESMKSRQDILTRLQDFRMSAKLRAFLSSSVILRDEKNTTIIQGSRGIVKKALSWNFDISSIIASENSIQSFPHQTEFMNKIYEGPVLLMRAHPKKSFYVQDDDVKSMCNLFPQTRIINIDAGHWLHSEASDIAAFHLAAFLNTTLNILPDSQSQALEY